MIFLALPRAWIVQDHPVDVQKCAELSRDIAGRHRAVQRFELALHFADSELKTLDLRRHLLGGDCVVSDLERCMGDELRAADRDACRDADAMQREADHYGPPRSRLSPLRRPRGGAIRALGRPFGAHTRPYDVGERLSGGAQALA
jgi:hypothetical protein